MQLSKAQLRQIAEQAVRLAPVVGAPIKKARPATARGARKSKGAGALPMQSHLWL